MVAQLLKGSSISRDKMSHYRLYCSIVLVAAILVKVGHAKAFKDNDKTDQTPHRHHAPQPLDSQPSIAEVLNVLARKSQLQFWQDLIQVSAMMGQRRLASERQSRVGGPIEYDDFPEVVPFLQAASMPQNGEIYNPPAKRYRKSTTMMSLVDQNQLSFFSSWNRHSRLHLYRWQI